MERTEYLMAIFNTLFESSDTDITTDVLDEELAKADLPDEDVNTELDGGDELVKEFNESTYMLEAAMYIADVQLETAVYEGSSVESLMENAVTDFLKKAKENILKLWNKLQTWIRETIANIRAFASASTGFVKKHETEIKKRFANNGDTYDYSGYDFDESGFDKCSYVIDIIKGESQSALNAPASSDTMATIFSKVGAKLNASGDTNSVAELGARIQDLCRGVEVNNKKPDSTTVDNWIKTVKDASTILKQLSKAEADAKKHFNTIITDLKKKEKEAEKAKESDNASRIHNAVKFNNLLASAVSKVTTVFIKCRTEQFKAYSRRLKEIYALKEKKEKKTEATNEGFSLLDAAFNIL